MSKIALTPNASGTGTFSIASPGTNTDRTLTLPDATGTVLTDQSTVSATQIAGALNASGSAPFYACRAWVNFNGSVTVTIRGSGNVTSVTDNGTGDYTVNFTTAMPDANYAAVVTGTITFGSFYGVGAIDGASAPSTTSVRVISLNSVGGAARSDAPYMMVSVFR
jgi:hypothetical protein